MLQMSKEKILRIANEKQTLALGRWIGERLPLGSVVGLNGALGAGKTWMAKGIVDGIGDSETSLVKSPAYNLVHEYGGVGNTPRVFHMDFYRLGALSPSDAMLFGEILDRTDAIHLVEWASRFLSDLIPEFLSVTLSFCKPPESNCRMVCIKPTGEGVRYRDLMQAITCYAHTDP